MTTMPSGESRPRMDPAEMQLLLTGVREALDEVRRQRSVPRFRHTADPSLFIASARASQTPSS